MMTTECQYRVKISRCAREAAQAGLTYTARLIKACGGRAMAKAEVARAAARLRRRADRAIAESARHSLSTARSRRSAAVTAAVRAAYDDCDYRAPSDRWAGGNVTVDVATGSCPSVSSSVRTVWDWSSRGPREGRDVTHRIVVRPTWDGIPESVRVIDGLLTLELGPWASGADPDTAAAPAIWAVQGVGLSLREEQGYIGRSRIDGERWAYFHARSRPAALAGARKAAAVARARAADVRSQATRLTRLTEHSNVIVTWEHVRAAGACPSGVRSWCAAVGIDPSQPVTVGDVLVGLARRPNQKAIDIANAAIGR